MDLHHDFKDLLAVFAEEGVRYLLVGGYAVGFHSRPRFTKDIDFWIADEPVNVERAFRALARFGAPAEVLSQLKAMRHDEIFFMGAPPVRVDVLKHVDGVEFEDAYLNRVEAHWDGVRVHLMGLEDLMASKRAAGREQDLLDLKALERAKEGSKP
jgi:predicted nucleotidyltransferase